MKRKNLIILFFIALISLSSTSSLSYHLVKRVYDGDTILIETGEKVRYLGIDAPETGGKGEKSEFMAIASRDFNSRLVGNTRVKLEFDKEKRDRHGRILAYVYLENGDMVNALLVKRGFARVMIKRPNIKYFSLLLNDQREAMAKKNGIWSRDSKKLEKHYLGSSKSYRFHRPGCPFAKKILPHNFVSFKDSREAFWEGFSPCKQCIP